MTALILCHEVARHYAADHCPYDPAATDFTVIVVPSTDPVTFAFAPARSFSLSSAA
jgi:hypothetical protein